MRIMVSRQLAVVNNMRRIGFSLLYGSWVQDLRPCLDVQKINATKNVITQLQEPDILRLPHGHTYISTASMPAPMNAANHPAPRDGSIPSTHLKPRSPADDGPLHRESARFW